MLMNNTAFPPGNPLPHFQWTLRRLLPYYRLGLSGAIDPGPNMRFTEVLSNAVAKTAGINYPKIGAIVRTRDEALTLIRTTAGSVSKKVLLSTLHECSPEVRL
jgi:hypothetical protein